MTAGDKAQVLQFRPRLQISYYVASEMKKYPTLTQSEIVHYIDRPPQTQFATLKIGTSMSSRLKSRDV